MLNEIDREMLDMTARLREKFPSKAVRFQYKDGLWSIEIGVLDEKELRQLFQTMEEYCMEERRC